MYTNIDEAVISVSDFTLMISNIQPNFDREEFINFMAIGDYKHNIYEI